MENSCERVFVREKERESERVRKNRAEGRKVSEKLLHLEGKQRHQRQVRILLPIINMHSAHSLRPILSQRQRSPYDTSIRGVQRVN